MKAKIAIFSDIHGNSIGLKAVLEELEKIPDIEHIYCLGDIIAVGHETNEVFRYLFNREDISFVKGNHDQEIIHMLNGKEDPLDPLLDHHRWVADRINDKFKEKLLNVPKKIYREHGGKKFLFAHYQFDKNGNYLPSDFEPSVRKLDEYYKNEEVDVVCFGHHHRVHFFQSETRTYINPGPVGLDNNRPVAKYCIIEIDDNGYVNANFREVQYDLDSFRDYIKAFYELRVPLGDKIVKSAYPYATMQGQ